jgi:uncharacterized OsmC-like protein
MPMNATAMKLDEPVIRNGVDVSALFATIEAVKADPAVAEFRFRARNRWLGGDANCTTISGFHGAKQEQPHARPFELDCGEPPVLLGRDRGANPVEHLLNALIGCLTTTLVYHAAARGIEVAAIESELEGDLDLRGFLGIAEDVRKGYREIRVRMRVRSKASPALLRDLAQFSPVFDVVSRALPVHVTVETH